MVFFHSCACNDSTAFTEEKGSEHIKQPDSLKVHEIYFRCKLRFSLVSHFYPDTEHPPLSH